MIETEKDGEKGKQTKKLYLPAISPETERIAKYLVDMKEKRNLNTILLKDRRKMKKKQPTPPLPHPKVHFSFSHKENISPPSCNMPSTTSSHKETLSSPSKPATSPSSPTQQNNNNKKETPSRIRKQTPDACGELSNAQKVKIRQISCKQVTKYPDELPRALIFIF
jgi:hypothetical protein